MKRITLLLSLLAGTLCAADAADFLSGSLYYNLLPDGNVEVAPSEAEPYTGELTIPSTVLYAGEIRYVTGIGDHAFAASNGLREVIIPDGVKYIGEYAFYDCCDLEEVGLPESLTVISDRAFALCGSLRDVRLPARLTEVGDNAFTRCSSLILHGSIPVYADFGSGVFSYCSSLEHIDLSEHSGTLGEGAFQGCYALESVKFNMRMPVIPAYCFSDCHKLTTPVLPDELLGIGAWAFTGCTAIESVAMPMSLSEIGERAFAGCCGITSITFSNEGHLSIGEGAFENLTMLPELFLEGDISVGDRAFANAVSLEWVEIERGVESFGSGVFANCVALHRIYAHNEWPAQITVNTFDTATEQSATLYVFPEARERYAMAAYWDRFKAIESTTDFPLQVLTPETDKGTLIEKLIHIVDGELIVSPNAGYSYIYDSTGVLRFSGMPDRIAELSLEKGIYVFRCESGTIKLSL